MTQPPRTLYQIANTEIRHCIDAYLELAAVSNGLTTILPEHLASERTKTILATGFGFASAGLGSEGVYLEWQRRQAQLFDLETAITAGVYSTIRSVGGNLFDELSAGTKGFSSFNVDYLVENPHFLPLLQHLSGIFSKARLKEHVGSASDTGISKPAAARLVKLLSERIDPKSVVRAEVLARLESTLEGIVRDLIGRVLLESIVEAALQRQKLPFLREREYESLPGVVYDFRPDFILPSPATPKVFIEVRKSSSRHASLYAKDKMFSAINWKGKTDDLLAVLVVDGEWTNETLRVMANVFDYVVPIGRIDELVDSIKAYLDGDRNKLKWLIEFRISPANPNEVNPINWAGSG